MTSKDEKHLFAEVMRTAEARVRLSKPALANELAHVRETMFPDADVSKPIATVLIPRAEYEALKKDAERGRKALWELMQCKPSHYSAKRLLHDCGMIDGNGEWTPGAAEFAKDMEGK